MRNQHVHRLPEFDVLLARCPECATVHTPGAMTTSGQTWLSRLATGGVIAWMIVLTALCVALVAAQFAFSLGTLEELTRHRPIDNTRKEWVRVVDLPEEVDIILGVMRGGALLTGFAFMTLLTVACHHWRRASYVLLAITVPCAVAGVAGWIWRVDAPHLVAWGDQLLLVSAACQLTGTVLGAVFGRRVVRLAACMFLPGRLRAALSFLWTADGLVPPRRLT